MAQIASIASLVGTGAAIYGQVSQAQQQRKQQRQVNAAAQVQEVARDEQARLAESASKAARDDTLRRTIARTRARLAAGGVNPDGGSAAALTEGLRQDAAAEDAASEAQLEARLAAGRRSLLQPDGTLNAFLRTGNSLGTLSRNLLG